MNALEIAILAYLAASPLGGAFGLLIARREPFDVQLRCALLCAWTWPVWVWVALRELVDQR